MHGNKKLLLVGRPESVIIHRISSLQESLKCNDRILLFSQSLFTLNLIEDFLKKKKLTNVEVGVYCLSVLTFKEQIRWKPRNFSFKWHVITPDPLFTQLSQLKTNAIINSQSIVRIPWIGPRLVHNPSVLRRFGVSRGSYYLTTHPLRRDRRHIFAVCKIFSVWKLIPPTLPWDLGLG